MYPVLNFSIISFPCTAANNFSSFGAGWAYLAKSETPVQGANRDYMDIGAAVCRQLSKPCCHNKYHTASRFRLPDRCYDINGLWGEMEPGNINK